jgi:hypothetical protein
MTHSRPSAARTLDPTSGLYTSVPSGEKRIFGPQQGLLVEAAARTNPVKWSSEITVNNWGSINATQIAKIDSIIDGEQAVRWEDDTSGQGGVRENFGVHTSNEEVAYVIAEEQSADAFEVLLKDASNYENVAKASYRFSNDSVTPGSIGGELEANRRILTESGPNGGRVVQLILRYDASDVDGADRSGTNRRLRIHVNIDGDTKRTALHHAQIEEAPNASSPIVTGSSAVTRGGDQATINVGDWWNEQEMTFFYEIIPQFFHLNDFADLLLNISGRIRLYDTAPWGVEFRDRNGNRGPFVGSVSPFESTKIAVSFIAGPDEVRLAVDGNVEVDQGGITVDFSGVSEYDLLSSFDPLPSTVVKTHRATPKALPATDLKTLTV